MEVDPRASGRQGSALRRRVRRECPRPYRRPNQLGYPL